VLQSLRRHERTEPPIANQCSKGDTLNFCAEAQKKFNSRLVAPIFFRKKPFDENVEGLFRSGSLIE
jgi:hypothetical protein